MNTSPIPRIQFLVGGMKMFLTIKFNRKTAVAAILAVAVALILLVIIFSGGSSGSGKITCTEDRVEYLKGLGWEVDVTSETEQSVLIPREFTGVYLEYNKLQKQQGFDLEEFLGTEVLVYTYIVSNYGCEDTVIAAIYVYNNRIVAGDIHSTTLDGFMHGIM